jgi:hypothetical protein
LALFPVKQCTRQFQSLPITAVDHESQLDRDADTSAKQGKIGCLACGRSFLERRASSQRADSKSSVSLAFRNLVKTLLMVFYKSPKRKNHNDYYR